MVGWAYSCVHCDRTRRRVIEDFPVIRWSAMQGPVDSCTQLTAHRSTNFQGYSCKLWGWNGDRDGTYHNRRPHILL
jgi:hypothetical protein